MDIAFVTMLPIKPVLSSGHAADADPSQHITKISGGGDTINDEAQPKRNTILLNTYLKN